MRENLGFIIIMYILLVRQCLQGSKRADTFSAWFKVSPYIVVLPSSHLHACHFIIIQYHARNN